MTHEWWRVPPAFSFTLARHFLIGALFGLLCCPVLAISPQSGSPASESATEAAAGTSSTYHSPGRTFFWTEINLIGFYSPGKDRIDLSPRPQRTSVGFEVAGAFASKTVWGERLRGVSFDIHPLVILDPVSRHPKLVFHDAWIKVGVKHHPQTSLKVGHFLIPFGQNPILEPRGFFFLPLTAADLGFKRDWGVSFQTVVSKYVYEVALTAGSGLGIHHRDGSYMVSGRIGTPTYKDFEYGLSALYGKVPEIRAERILSNQALTRWRVGADMIYKYGTYTLFKGEFAAGKDAEAPVLGYQMEVDYIFPRWQDWEAKVQLGSWFDDVRRRSDDTSVITGLFYSLSTSSTLSVNYIHDFRRRNRQMKDDRIFLHFHFYF